VSDAAHPAGRIVDELVREPSKRSSNGELAGHELTSVHSSVSFVLGFADEQICCGDCRDSRSTR
jgi:hypothetical protein